MEIELNSWAFTASCMMPAALNQGLGIGFLASLALSKLARGLHSGLGVTAVKVQICWWSELEGVSAGAQLFNLNCVHGGDSYIPVACILHHQMLPPPCKLEIRCVRSQQRPKFLVCNLLYLTCYTEA